MIRVGCVARILGESFFDLGCECKGKGVEALRKIADILKEIVIGDEGGNGSEESRGSGDKGFGDTGSDSAKAGGTGGAEPGEGVDDSPDRAEEADKGSYASGSSKPGHTLFNAANFLGGSQLHGDGDGLHGFELLWSGITCAGQLALEFSIAGSVDGRERGTCRDQALGIGDAFGGAEDIQKLVAFATNAAEKARLLEDERPRDKRKDEEKEQDKAGDPAGLRENLKDVANVECGEQRNDVSP
jgi:hypothetical protein